MTSPTELKISLTLRMFIEPKLDLDLLLLEQHLYQVKQRKEELLASVGVDKKDLMSNPKLTISYVSYVGPDEEPTANRPMLSPSQMSSSRRQNTKMIASRLL